MKTTLEIAKPLLKEVTAVAGLQLVLSERQGGKRPFKLSDASVDVEGLHPDAVGRSWDELCARSYDGRGG